MHFILPPLTPLRPPPLTLDTGSQHPAGGASSAAGYHAYLLLSKAPSPTAGGGEGGGGGLGSSMVLQTGEELQEVTQGAPYRSDQRTVCAGNLFNNAGICQVGIWRNGHARQI